LDKTSSNDRASKHQIENPSKEEEEQIVNLANEIIEPSLAELEKIISTDGEPDIIRIKQIISIIIGFLSGIQTSFIFDHGENLPIENHDYDSVILGEFPTTYSHQSEFLKSKIGHIPSKTFKLMTSLLTKLEQQGDVSEYRILRILFLTMSFCFNFKSRNGHNSISTTDHFKRIYGLHRLQKPRTYPYVVYEYRGYHDLLNRRMHSYDYSYFTENHLTYMRTLIRYGQSPFTKIRKMSQSMFRNCYKSSWLINICGSHLQGRQYMFLQDIIGVLEEQTAEKHYDGTDLDELEDHDDHLDDLDNQTLVDYLASKSQDELQTEKYKPYLTKIKEDQTLFKEFYSKFVANQQKNEAKEDKDDEKDGGKDEKMETNVVDDTTSHKKLKGALYLLDKGSKNTSKQSYLFNGHRADLCAKIWPLILRVRCDKRSVNQLVQSFSKVIIDTYTTIEFKNSINEG